MFGLLMTAYRRPWGAVRVCQWELGVRNTCFLPFVPTAHVCFTDLRIRPHAIVKLGIFLSGIMCAAWLHLLLRIALSGFDLWLDERLGVETVYIEQMIILEPVLMTNSH